MVAAVLPGLGMPRAVNQKAFMKIHEALLLAHTGNGLFRIYLNKRPTPMQLAAHALPPQAHTRLLLFGSGCPGPYGSFMLRVEPVDRRGSTLEEMPVSYAIVNRTSPTDDGLASFLPPSSRARWSEYYAD